MTELRKFSLKKRSIVLLVVTIFTALTLNNKAHGASPFQIGSTLTNLQDTTKPLQKDSVARTNDSTKITDLLSSTQRIDTFSLKLSKDSLDGPVNYEAEDSAVVLVQSQKILLYGKTRTAYKDVVLTAPRVELEQQTSMVTALSSRDSTGAVITRAHFEQGE